MERLGFSKNTVSGVSSLRTGSQDKTDIRGPLSGGPERVWKVGGQIEQKIIAGVMGSWEPGGRAREGMIHVMNQELDTRTQHSVQNHSYSGTTDYNLLV